MTLGIPTLSLLNKDEMDVVATASVGFSTISGQGNADQYGNPNGSTDDIILKAGSMFTAANTDGVEECVTSNWVKMDLAPPATTAEVYSQWENQADFDRAWRMRVDLDVKQFQFFKGQNSTNQKQIFSSTGLATNIYHHVACVWDKNDGTPMRLYINGLLDNASEANQGAGDNDWSVELSVPFYWYRLFFQTTHFSGFNQERFKLWLGQGPTSAAEILEEYNNELVAIATLGALANTAITIDEAKNQLRLELGDDDPLIESMIRASTITAETFTNRSFLDTRYEMKLDEFPRGLNDSDRVIRPNRSPLSCVIEITYIDEDGVNQRLDTSEYKVDTDSEPGRITEEFDKTWPATRRETNAVTVVYVAGYGVDATTVPKDIKSALKLMVGHLYEDREASTSLSLTELPVHEILLSSSVVPAVN